MTWTKEDLIHWRIYTIYFTRPESTASGHNKLWWSLLLWDMGKRQNELHIFTQSTEVSSSVWLIESETNSHRSVFADIFTLNFLDENCGMFIEISLKFVFNGLINSYPALSITQVIAWRRSSDKPLSQPMMAKFSDVYNRPSASMS